MRCKEQFDSWFGKIRPQEKSECVSVCWMLVMQQLDGSFQPSEAGLSVGKDG